MSVKDSHILPESRPSCRWLACVWRDIRCTLRRRKRCVSLACHNRLSKKPCARRCTGFVRMVTPRRASHDGTQSPVSPPRYSAAPTVCLHLPGGLPDRQYSAIRSEAYGKFYGDRVLSGISGRIQFHPYWLSLRVVLLH